MGFVFKIVGGVLGGLSFLSFAGGIILVVLRVCLQEITVRRRSGNVEAAQANPTSTRASAGTGRRVRLVPPTNPKAPTPYVPSANAQSSNPPPYTTDPNKCSLPTAIEDTPTPQPLPPESPPPIPNDEDPPEYLPPPEGDQQQTPL